MNFTITPIDATLGATITDIDLTSLEEATWQALYAEFLEYGMLVFPGQNLDDDQQGKFAARFGIPEQLNPKQKGATVAISNTKPDGSVTKPHEYQYQILKGNEGWHTDSTYMPLASKVAMLAARVLPPEGGETEFADMRAAWDALDEATQNKLEGLSAFHSLYYSQEKAGYQHKTDNLYGLHDKGAPLRPIIKQHPETGRKSIYTGRHAYGILGMDPEASETLLTELLTQACQPPRVYRHTWQVGDIVVWDNRCLMHRACPFDESYPRVLRGTRIAGDPESELAPTYADERASGFSPSTSNTSPLAASH
ncbi:MAG: TauD/TfdA family dioxygenase [Pseudomonadales bacterium]|nr:TauD/TfdA family dioxygenase [Pseudomonadales bacterium]